MKLHNATASIFVPDGQSVPDALKRITHLGIGAHQDDLEFMAFHGIIACYGSSVEWFGGVTCTNGSDSPRVGPYANFTDAQMMAERGKEQEQAALAGRYGVMIQLDYPSSVINKSGTTALKDDLKQILAATRPKILYTHNPADKHETHVAVVVAAVQAMRELPGAERPLKVWGCEVWRDLDWLPDEDKVLMDVSGRNELSAELTNIFKSQIAGGKRYDLAIQGRRRANATFLESHATDKTTELTLGIDLTPLVTDDSRDIVEHVCAFIDEFKSEVQQQLRKQLGHGP